ASVAAVTPSIASALSVRALHGFQIIVFFPSELQLWRPVHARRLIKKTWYYSLVILLFHFLGFAGLPDVDGAGQLAGGPRAAGELAEGVPVLELVFARSPGARSCVGAVGVLHTR